MRVFVYEFCCGGGWYLLDDRPPPASLLREGAAMLSALTADFADLPDVAVLSLRDIRGRRFDAHHSRELLVSTAVEHDRAFAAMAAEADCTIVIAPEIGGMLERQLQQVEAVGGKALAPYPRVVQVAADKNQTASHLTHHGVPIPKGVAFHRRDPLPSDLIYPALWKPADGAGSTGIRWIDSANADESHVLPDGRIEEYRPGVAVSVAFLCGPACLTPLPPCRQLVRPDSGFCYQGGESPLPPELAARATRLATMAVDTLRDLGDIKGYLGVDLVMGEESSGRDDVVIEFNPRLTTSYIGLRHACRDNLAIALMAVTAGDPIQLQFLETPIRFDPGGKVLSVAESCT